MNNELMQSIIETIMTQHWDMKACECWICQSGREAGCRPRDTYMMHKHPEKTRPTVRVDFVEAI